MDRRNFLAASATATGIVAIGSSLWPHTAQAGRRRLELISRESWRGRAPTRRFRHHRIDRITVHHSAVALTDNRDAPARVRAHQEYHQSLGWPDIGYHVVIDRHGNVYKGRPFWAAGGTATEYDPRGHLLVMCEGNFESQRVTSAQLRSLVNVLTWGCATFDVAPRRIRGHRHYAATACPGRRLGRLIADGTLRRAVRQVLADGGVGKSWLGGEAGRRRVAAIERGDA